MINLLSTTNDIRFKFLRAKVVDNKDKEKYGRVKVFIPEFMMEMNDTKDGLWAWPANASYGGGNTRMDEQSREAGSLYIPTVGQWVWIFFEDNNPNRPYYISALYIQNKKVPPETRQGTQWWNKWLLLRSPNGNAMWISDDPDDAGMYITGKKRKNTPENVFKIKGNQSIINIDDRANKEKILIADYTGNYFYVDTNKSKAYMYMSNSKGTGQINIFTNQNLITIDDSGYIRIQVPDATLELNNGIVKVYTQSSIHIKSAGPVNVDGSLINLNCGESEKAQKSEIPNIDIDGLMPVYKETK